MLLPCLKCLSSIYLKAHCSFSGGGYITKIFHSMTLSLLHMAVFIAKRHFEKHSYCDQSRHSADLTCHLAWLRHLLVLMKIDKFNAILWNISGKAMTCSSRWCEKVTKCNFNCEYFLAKKNTFKNLYSY
ncbi:hypothetical protein NL108_012281 [Boleophthalmus pectinirostris]|nr:hypothetical protein NL108_012281 [Boleophthalmus pectinirostris]